MLYCKTNKTKCGLYSEYTKLTQKLIIAAKVLLRYKICALKLILIMYVIYDMLIGITAYGITYSSNNFAEMK